MLYSDGHYEALAMALLHQLGDCGRLSLLSCSDLEGQQLRDACLVAHCIVMIVLRTPSFLQKIAELFIYRRNLFSCVRTH